MAMDDKNGILTLIQDLVDTTAANQTVGERKSNTVVTAIGTVLTMLVTGGAYLVESETTLPSWFPLLMTFIGMAATVMKVSKTPNGVTDSVVEKLQNELVNRIDLTHLHDRNNRNNRNNRHIEEPSTEELFPVDRAMNLRAVAENIVRGSADRR